MNIQDDGRYTGVMPELSNIEFETLRADIAERGVLVPIDVDEQGHVINGRHRLRACRELGIDPPVFVRVGLDEIGKRALARTINTLGRRLSRAQIRDVIAGQLRDTPQWSDARIARALAVSDKTVRVVRRRLEATSEIPRLSTFESADGRKRPAMRSTFVANLEDVPPHALQRALLPPEEEQAIWDAVGTLFNSLAPETFDPFAGLSEAEIRTWLVFESFLATRCGLSPAGAADHCSWLRRRPFNVVEWMGAEGAAFRDVHGMPPIPHSTVRAWEAFVKTHADRTIEDLERELATVHHQHRQQVTTL